MSALRLFFSCDEDVRRGLRTLELGAVWYPEKGPPSRENSKSHDKWTRGWPWVTTPDPLLELSNGGCGGRIPEIPGLLSGYEVVDFGERRPAVRSYRCATPACDWLGT